MGIYKNIMELTGGTPLMELCNYEKKNQLEAVILAKLECFNPAGSVKDRIAKKILLDAWERGDNRGFKRGQGFHRWQA